MGQGQVPCPIFYRAHGPGRIGFSLQAPHGARVEKPKTLSFYQAASSYAHRKGVFLLAPATNFVALKWAIIVRNITISSKTKGLLVTNAMNMRVGLGFDVHAFAQGRKLILGGVDIPHHQGLLGHSDADVLAHAISDALLGAARAGDIGKLFPDTDPAYAGADSMVLLSCVANYVRELGFDIVDVDSVISAQAPKLSPFRDQMRENLAHAMGIDVDQVGVKATTTEHLGFEGREEGISAQAVALLSKRCC